MSQHCERRRRETLLQHEALDYWLFEDCSKEYLTVLIASLLNGSVIYQSAKSRSHFLSWISRLTFSEESDSSVTSIRRVRRFCGLRHSSADAILKHTLLSGWIFELEVIMALSSGQMQRSFHLLKFLSSIKPLSQTSPSYVGWEGRMLRGTQLPTTELSLSRCEVWVPVRCMGSSKAKEEPRGSLWRTRSVISKETVQAVHDLRRSKDSPEDLKRTFQNRISRLLKMDLLATLAELQRQNELSLALKVFDVVRKEIWYKPDKFLYRQMMDALGRNRMIPELEQKFQELQEEGIVPDVVIYRELVGAYVRSHMLDRALEVHKKMIEIGCGDDRLSNQFIEKEKTRIERKAALKAETGDADAGQPEVVAH
ncbi:hypothetical protein R1flu_018422 [Riccia fluitans]|uniref:Pentatricopeptide repeat-containing protein n=1 Tax=Riccia fluitans TaxID=41844 RepID=A0ABD1ZFT0_9MARC